MRESSTRPRGRSPKRVGPRQPSAVRRASIRPRATRKPAVVQPVLPLEAKVVSSREPGLLRRLWLRGRGYLTWLLVVCVALLDPGLILAVLFVAAATAASLFLLGMIATSLTTLAILSKVFPKHLRAPLRTPIAKKP